MKIVRRFAAPMTRRALCCATLAFVFLLTATAWADSPDVVRKKDGGLLRGTIEELDPKGSVTIVLSNGDRRTIPMSEVEFAGASPPQTGSASTTRDASKPMITVTAEESALDLTSSQQDVTFHLKTAESHVSGVGVGSSGSSTAVVSYSGQVARYSRLCTAPCRAHLANGSYTFALSMNGGDSVAADPVRVRGPVRLEGTYVSNQGTRTAGFVLAGASLGVGLYLMLTATTKKQDCSIGASYCYESSELDSTKFLLGAVVGTLGPLIGVFMARTSDDAKITVLPGTSALRGRGEVASGTTPELRGATVALAFLVSLLGNRGSGRKRRSPETRPANLDA